MISNDNYQGGDSCLTDFFPAKNHLQKTARDCWLTKLPSSFVVLPNHSKSLKILPICTWTPAPLQRCGAPSQRPAWHDAPPQGPGVFFFETFRDDFIMPWLRKYVFQSDYSRYFSRIFLFFDSILYTVCLTNSIYAWYRLWAFWAFMIFSWFLPLPFPPRNHPSEKLGDLLQVLMLHLGALQLQTLSLSAAKSQWKKMMQLLDLKIPVHI